MKPTIRNLCIFLLLLIITAPVYASSAHSNGNGNGISLLGIRIEFIIFALTLTGIALFHRHTLAISLAGLLIIFLYSFFTNPAFSFYHHLFGDNSITSQIIHKNLRQGEWIIIINLTGLLIGFAILSKLFEYSHIPEITPRFLPSSWVGAFLLLAFVFILSSFLDNIAGAMIGGTIAYVVFKRKVHIGYLAAIVAASNAGGSGSVIGDTTTTMMWIEGVKPLAVFHAYIAAIGAFLFFAFFASKQQHAYQPLKPVKTLHKLRWKPLLAVISILACTILTNILFDLPALGVWLAIIAASFYTKVPWHEIKHSISGTVFLLCLVTISSLMPVESLPDPSWISAFVIGIASSVFDNIPLTKLALQQGGYDWGVLAYAVGFGGSMIWFGSSAGVAVSNMYPKTKSVFLWIKNGWHIAVSYVIGFALLIVLCGWNPD